MKTRQVTTPSTPIAVQQGFPNASRWVNRVWLTIVVLSTLVIGIAIGMGVSRQRPNIDNVNSPVLSERRSSAPKPTPTTQSGAPSNSATLQLPPAQSSNQQSSTNSAPLNNPTQEASLHEMQQAQAAEAELDRMVGDYNTFLRRADDAYTRNKDYDRQAQEAGPSAAELKTALIQSSTKMVDETFAEARQAQKLLLSIRSHPMYAQKYRETLTYSASSMVMDDLRYLERK